MRRLPDRGVYDRSTIDAILDEALICHVAWTSDDGEPRVIPTIHARIGDELYFHGSRASRALRSLRDGSQVCVGVTLIDALVLARSAFHHSMNYRSVVVYGTAREITARDAQLAVATAITDHIVSGRSADVRMPSDDELRQTMFVAIPLDEASAKVRTGPPADDEPDYGLPIWAGLLPLRLKPGTPIDDPRLLEGREAPQSVTEYGRE